MRVPVAGVDPAAEEAWLAVLSLHGDYDDDEWADLCEGERRAMGVGRPACGCRPTRALGTRRRPILAVWMTS